MDPTIIDGRDILTGKTICIVARDGMIESVEPGCAESGPWLSAGLVDLQVNGYRGHDLNSATMTPQTVSAIAREMLLTGVTTFAPTLITASKEDLLTRLRNIAVCCAQDPLAASCIGMIHVEGPHISPQDGYRGAHPLEDVRPPDVNEFEQWQTASGNRIGIVTMSPHFANSCEYIRHLVSRGVLVSIGHTHASTEEIRAAAEAGATLSTHLGNAMAAVLKRHPNPIWSQLGEDGLQAMFIADGLHLAPEVFRAMLRAKGVENSILVSDCVALAGMPAGKYTEPIGGSVVLTEDGRLYMDGTDLLAGAALPLVECLGRAAAMSGLPLREILPMATSHPGRLVGGRGELKPGMRADVIALHWDAAMSRASVEQVWFCGTAISAGALRM